MGIIYFQLLEKLDRDKRSIGHVLSVGGKEKVLNIYILKFFLALLPNRNIS
jgi:hypothetical protein